MNFKHLSPSDAHRLLTEDRAQWVDIRDPMSFRMGHIPTSLRLDNDNLPEFLHNSNKQQPLIVCCYHGNSSQGAAQYLWEQGFTEVYSLDGGFEYWRAAYPEHIEQGE